MPTDASAKLRYTVHGAWILAFAPFAGRALALADAGRHDPAPEVVGQAERGSRIVVTTA